MKIRDATPEDAGGMARVHVDSWRTTYRGIVPDEVLDNLSYAQREEQRRCNLEEAWPRSTTLVVEADDETIVGFGIAGPDRESGDDVIAELYAIYLLQEAQGRGAGRALFDALFDRLRAAGFTEMRLWVLEDNPTRGFYEHMGGQVIGQSTITIGKELTEIRYAFSLTE